MRSKNLVSHLSMLLLIVVMIGCHHAPPPQAQPVSTSNKIISVSEAWTLIHNGAFVIDVRTRAEFDSGHLDHAINIPHTEISQNLTTIGSDKNREIILYCR